MPIKVIFLPVESMGERRFARSPAHGAMGSRLQSPGRVAEHSFSRSHALDEGRVPTWVLVPDERAIIASALPWSPRTSLLPGARADPGKVLELDGGPEDSIGGTKFYTKLTIPEVPSRLLNAVAFLLPTWEHPRVSEIPEPSVEAGSVAVI